MYSQAQGVYPTGVLSPVNYFIINGRVLNLYYVANRPHSAAFSLYWDDEQNPVQHGMTHLEVFNIIAGLLNESAEEARTLEEVPPTSWRSIIVCLIFVVIIAGTAFYLSC